MLSKYKLLCFIMLNILISTSNAATSIQTSVCDDPHHPYKVAQCLYVTGLKDNDRQRWIKTSIPGVFEQTVCFGSIEQTHRYSIMEAHYPIKNPQPILVADVSICTDQTGKNCQKITSYKFSCTTDDAQGHCDPVDMPVDISSVKDSFPTCDRYLQSKIVLQH